MLGDDMPDFTGPIPERFLSKNDDSDNILGYLLIEMREGEEPYVLGRMRPRALVTEMVGLWKAMQAPNPSRTYRLAKVQLVADENQLSKEAA